MQGERTAAAIAPRIETVKPTDYTVENPEAFRSGRPRAFRRDYGAAGIEPEKTRQLWSLVNHVHSLGPATSKSQ
jgi:hypothetical protein